MQYLRLDEILQDVHQNETIEFERLLFNGGEAHIKLKSAVPQKVTIEAALKNSGYVMELLMATDALRRAGAAEITLIAPYIPYGRQDRVMVPGEPLSIRVFANLINSQNYKTVYTLDNHSPVTTALLDRCVEIDNMPIMKELLSNENSLGILVSPDAGSEKKVQKIAQKLHRFVIRASKIRDVQTGVITATKIDHPDDTNYNCIIIDDICDGGRTFYELAKVLKEKGAFKVILYVSHGIFSQGVYKLKEYIDKIYTTNCFREDNDLRSKITILPLRKEDIK